VAGVPVIVVLAQVLAVQFELKPSHCFATARVVADETNFGLFTNVVLIALEDNVRNAFSCTYTKETTDLVFQCKLEVAGWEEQRRSEDVHVGLRAERRNRLLFVGPVFVMAWRELSFEQVPDLKACLFVAAHEKHACR
jgi:hypothetical protein